MDIITDPPEMAIFSFSYLIGDNPNIDNRLLAYFSAAYIIKLNNTQINTNTPNITLTIFIIDLLFF